MLSVATMGVLVSKVSAVETHRSTSISSARLNWSLEMNQSIAEKLGETDKGEGIEWR